MATGWDEAGRFYTDTASEHGLYPAASDTLSEIGEYLANLAGGTTTPQAVAVSATATAGLSRSTAKTFAISLRFLHNTTKD